MTEIARNRTILAALAAIAILLGLLVAGEVPRTAMPAPPAPAQAATGEGDAQDDQDQAQPFVVRDYAEFSQGSESDPLSSDWLGLLAGMMVKLGFVVALVYLGIMALRRYLVRGSGSAPSKKPVSLLGSLNLSPNRTVYVLEVGRKVLVVGATQSQLSLLTEVTDPDAAEEVRTLSAETPSAGQFPSLLKVAGRRFGGGESTLSEASTVDPVQTKVQEARDFMQKKIEEMRQPLRQA